MRIAPDLLARARAGESQARDEVLALLVADVRPMAWSYARSSGIDADDLLQEVAVRLWRNWQRVIVLVDPGPYAHRLARNLMIDEYRKTRALMRRPVAGVVSLDELEGWAL